jgi:hypothetical protein
MTEENQPAAVLVRGETRDLPIGRVSREGGVDVLKVGEG